MEFSIDGWIMPVFIFVLVAVVYALTVAPVMRALDAYDRPYESTLEYNFRNWIMDHAITRVLAIVLAPILFVLYGVFLVVMLFVIIAREIPDAVDEIKYFLTRK